MKKTISLGLFTVGFVVVLGLLRSMNNSSIAGKKEKFVLFDDINDFPIGI